MVEPTTETQSLMASDFGACIRDFQDLMTSFAAEHLIHEIFEPGPDTFEDIADRAAAALIRVKGGAAFKMLVRQLWLDRPWVGLRASYCIFADAGPDLRVPPPSICDGFIELLREIWHGTTSFVALDTLIGQAADTPEKSANDSVEKNYLEELRARYERLCDDYAKAAV